MPLANPAPGFARHPEHTITVEPYPGTVTVTANGATLARSANALSLAEANYPPVVYIPFSDIDFSQLEQTAHSTHCPFKGDASYWNVKPAGEKGANAMWAYQAPYDEMAGIKDHAAFYADRINVEMA